MKHRCRSENVLPLLRVPFFLQGKRSSKYKRLFVSSGSIRRQYGTLGWLFKSSLLLALPLFSLVGSGLSHAQVTTACDVASNVTESAVPSRTLNAFCLVDVNVASDGDMTVEGYCPNLPPPVGYQISFDYSLDPNIQLGATNTVDIAASTADGDDGITLPSLTQAKTTTITAWVTGAGAYLQAWIDFNGDGDFDDTGEQVATDYQDGGTGDTDSVIGTIAFDVNVPLSAVTTQTFARFRWSTAQNLDPTTAAIDGEVEDYSLVIAAEADTDNDGIPDNIEAQTTNGYIAPAADTSATFDSNNGLNSAYVGTNGLTPVNTDATAATNSDAIPDYIDTDSEGDGTDDGAENGLSSVIQTGLSDTSTNDTDGDGLFNVFETAIDADAGDGYVVNEGVNTPSAATAPYLSDADNDVTGGIPLSADLDYRDADAVMPDGDSGTATESVGGTPGNLTANWPAGISLNTTTGAIDVTGAVTPDTYELVYELCDTTTPTANCNIATVTITVDEDTDGDGVGNMRAIDDDNDGILGAAECTLNLSDFTPIVGGLFEGDADGVITQSIDGEALGTTFTIGAPTRISGGDTFT